MSKYLGPKLKLYKKEGINLYLKSGIKAIEKKCKFNKNIKNKIKISDYYNQLKEKQRLKRMYCILEKQFFNYFKKSLKSNKNTIELLLQLLERRLDNIVYRMGYGRTRLESRQLVNHKLVYVNNNIINIPSYKININDNIKINNKIFKNTLRLNFLLNYITSTKFPSWLYIDKNNLIGKILYIPLLNEINKDINGNLIIELYSR